MRVSRTLAVLAGLILGRLAYAEPIEQGVTIAFSQGGKADARAGRLLSLRVSEGSAATPFLSPGKFSATFSGFLNIRLRGEYSFAVLGRGRVVVKVKGQAVLEASGEDFGGKASGLVKLEKGKNPIEVVYESAEKGDSWVRVLWTSRDFPAEPVQPAALSHDAGAEAVRAGMKVREGRELLASLRCTACHPLPKAQWPPGTPVMPELEADAPDLSDVRERLKENWMSAWIADPKALRGDASMPRVFHDADAGKANDVAAYLATLGKAAVDEGKETDDEAVTQGSQVFAALGCIGCHTKADVEEADKELGRVPLRFMNAKFKPGALRAWLLNPQAHYGWARMPNFHLNDLEADRLAAYLSKNAKGEIPERAKGDAAKGRAIFASAGCANCHRMKDVPASAAVKTMENLFSGADWSKGCRGADFSLSAEQCESLAAVAKIGLGSLHNDVLPEFAERSIRRLQCNACHARDEVEDRWSNLAEEVGDLMPPEVNTESDQGDDAAGAAKGPRLFYPRGLGKLRGGDRIVISGDQSRPTLTWAGEKLRPEWAASFIAGELSYKPRYWLRSRMPAFAIHAKGIAQGLALEHGFPIQSEPPGASNGELAAVGQKLAGRDGGFACITCHSIGETRAISPFEAPAPNFIHIKERITHDYFVRWMRKPMRLSPGTKMPQYSEEGKSSLKEIMGGEADRQFEAIWNYLLLGERMVAPE
jgi:mono/diheme cytochrome c family protein